MINKCLNLRIRTSKGIKHQVCLKSGLKWQINENLCYMCEFKEYKKVKTIKKVSKKREFVTDETYKKVFLRDKGKCKLCNTTDNLHLHHINGRGKDKTNNVDNCIMLCENCHLNIVHKNNKYYRQYLNNLIGGNNEIKPKTI